MLKQFGVVAAVVMVIVVSAAIIIGTYQTGKKASEDGIDTVKQGIKGTNTVQIIEFEQPEIVTQ